MDWLEDELKFEDELRKALRRQEPSPDFDARVTSRVTAAASRRRPVLMRFPRPLAAVPWPLGLMPRWLATAAAVLVITVAGTGAGAGYRYHRGHVAKEQVMFAMRLAGSRLNRIQMQMKAVRP